MELHKDIPTSLLIDTENASQANSLQIVYRVFSNLVLRKWLEIHSQNWEKSFN